MNIQIEMPVVKRILPLLVFIFSTIFVMAQYSTPSNEELLAEKEDSLSALAKELIVDSLTAGRMRSDSLFVRTLVRALQIKNSFNHPFDSVLGISKAYAPDSSFRIFTWTLSFNEYYSRQRGAIQIRTDDGSMKLFPLRDYSEYTTAAEDSARDAAHWIGAVYYKILLHEHRGKKYYTMFGFDNFSIRSNKKWIEVLHFNERNEPVFGGPFFSFAEDSIPRPVQHRFSIEYKKDANALIHYDEEMQMILIDHLISESDEPDLKFTYIPDGSYEGFVWRNGKWLHVDKVFDFKLEDGEFPVPDPIMDEAGKENEEKLKKSTEKNKKGGGIPQ